MYHLETLHALWSRIAQILTMFNFPTDLIDIAIVAFLIYKILTAPRSRSASMIIKAAIGLLALAYLSNLLALNTLNYIVDKALEVGIIAIVIVFQPELRRLLARLDSNTMTGFLMPKQQTSETEKTIDAVVTACRGMSREKIGVLIVFERTVCIDRYFKAGTVVDAAVSSELLKNIFFPKAALHDGAVVIRDDRIEAAGCVLPLTEDPDLSRDLGTRHRAAIGITEVSDAVVVVVSEETGVISCMMPGVRKRYLTPDNLKKLLQAELVVEEKEKRLNIVRRKLAELLNRRKDEDSHEGE